MDFEFEPSFRTYASAQWLIRAASDGAPRGRVDAHFSEGAARVMLIVTNDVDDDTLEDMIARIDDELVPQDSRADVKVTAWRGERLGTFVPDPED